MCGSTPSWERLQELSHDGGGDRSAAVYEMMLWHSGMRGSTITKNKPRAEQLARRLLPWLQSEARRRGESNQHAIFGLGICHNFPIVLEKDDKQALKLYQRAEKQGHLIARTYLGNFYFHGCGGVTADFKHSTALYKSAANGGFSEAQVEWGMSFEQLKKRKEAYTAYQMAATQGNCQGQHNVGVCLYNAFGATRDKKEGVAWLKLAADQGYAPSMEFFEDCDSSEDE
jgi:TPR repeat protein